MLIFIGANLQTFEKTMSSIGSLIFAILWGSQKQPFCSKTYQFGEMAKTLFQLFHKVKKFIRQMKILMELEVSNTGGNIKIILITLVLYY